VIRGSGIQLVVSFFLSGPVVWADQEVYVSLDSAKKECVGNEKCEVKSFSEVGRIGERVFYAAGLCVYPSWSEVEGEARRNCAEERTRGLTFFESLKESGKLKVLFNESAERDLESSYSVQWVNNNDTPIVVIKIEADGTGHGNNSLYWIWNQKARAFRPFDAVYWEKEFFKRAPKGHGAWKGIWPDIKAGEALVGLFRKGDSNCCPSYLGTATLKIDQDRLVLVKAKFERQPR
jgi:hypothetical protein